jgi:hypothetical protein
MIDIPIYPFNVCKNVFKKHINNKKNIKIRKGDIVEVPPYDEDPMNCYIDLKNTIHSSMQLRSYAEINTNGSYDYKSGLEKSN